MRTPHFIVVFLVMLCLSGYGQDLHFSQFPVTPSYINPALTGKFNGDGRFIANNRSQWRSVTVPYQSSAISADWSHLGLADNTGAGVSLYYDKAGDSKLTTFKLDASLSYTINLTYNREHSLVFGLQGGLKNITIDYTALRFNNQYNGTNYDPNLATGENFSFNRLLAATASTGVSYFYATKSNVIIAGFGVHNLIRSNQSFFENGSSPLDIRVTGHVGAEIASGDQYVFSPAVFYGQQGDLQELVFGGKAKSVLFDDRRYYRAMALGVYYRNTDALIATGNFEVNDFNFGVSYDFNISGLKKASGYRGAFEVSLVYIYSAKRSSSRRFSSCPIFI